MLLRRTRQAAAMVLLVASAWACSSSSCDPPKYDIGTTFLVTVTEAPAAPCASVSLSAGDSFELVVDDYGTNAGTRECLRSATTTPHWFGSDEIIDCGSVDSGFLSVACDLRRLDPACQRTISGSIGLNGEMDPSGNVMEGATYLLEEMVFGPRCDESMSCEDEYSIRVEGLAQ